MRSPLAVAVVTALAALGLTACGGLEWTESACSDGEVVVWHTQSTTGMTCAPEDGPVPDGYARYPAGRVPVWDQPPSDYEHLDADGEDLYYATHPNDPEYAFKDDLYAAYPQMSCTPLSEPLHTVDAARLEPVVDGPEVPSTHLELVAARNKAGNLCVRIAPGHADSGIEVLSYALRAEQGPVTWRQGGEALDRVDPLRIGARGCTTLTGEVTVPGTDGTPVALQAASRVGKCKGSAAG